MFRQAPARLYRGEEPESDNFLNLNHLSVSSWRRHQTLCDQAPYMF